MGSTGDFFRAKDSYRNHPLLKNQLRFALPGLGIAVAAFSVYLFVDGVSHKLAKPKQHQTAEEGDLGVGYQDFLTQNLQNLGQNMTTLASKRSSALLVVDMQNDFVLEDAPMRVNSGLTVLPQVVISVGLARRAGVQVIWVIREHDPSGHDIEWIRKHFFEDGKPGALLPGSPGAGLVDGLKVEKGDLIVVKKRWSAFFHTHLELLLKRLRTTQIVIAGVQTPNCIRQTAFDAVAYDYEDIVVLTDATGAATSDVHEANLFDMRKVGVRTINVEQWAAELERVPISAQDFQSQAVQESTLAAVASFGVISSYGMDCF